MSISNGSPRCARDDREAEGRYIDRHAALAMPGRSWFCNGLLPCDPDDNNLFEFRHCEEANSRRGSPDSYGVVSMSNGSPRFARDDGGLEGQ